MPDMTGRPGCRTMDMFGGSTAAYLARTPRIPLFVLIFIGLETKSVLVYQGRAGSTSIVQWTLRPVIFGVGFFSKFSSCGSPDRAITKLKRMTHQEFL